MKFESLSTNCIQKRLQIDSGYEYNSNYSPMLNISQQNISIITKTLLTASRTCFQTNAWEYLKSLVIIKMKRNFNNNFKVTLWDEIFQVHKVDHSTQFKSYGGTQTHHALNANLRTIILQTWISSCTVVKWITTITSWATAHWNMMSNLNIVHIQFSCLWQLNIQMFIFQRKNI